jgi:hypothetical protein
MPPESPLSEAFRGWFRRAERRRDAEEKVDRLLAGVERRNEIKREVRREVRAELTAERREVVHTVAAREREAACGGGREIARWAAQGVPLTAADCAFGHPHSGYCQARRRPL